MNASKEEGVKFRSDLEAHEWAMSLSIADVVRHLVEVLGATTVAEIGGVSETRAVAQWMSGREPQRPHVLRFALQIAAMISTEGDGEAARAWFHGSNPMLNDGVPALLLKGTPLPEIQASMMNAARQFAAYTA